MKLLAVLAAVVLLGATIMPAAAQDFRPSYWAPQAATQWHPGGPQARPHREIRRWATDHTQHRHVAQWPAQRHGAVIGGRPRGCPYEYCGCSASLFIFHRIIAALNLAANWLRFPHVAAAPGMAAVAPSRHHVLVLEHHVRGQYWRVHDGNSGHHLTRDHVRSIAGWTVVDPTTR